MHDFLARTSAFALAWGAPGLFGVAFLDSSLLPLPGVVDVIVIVFATRRPEAMLLYALAATTGSLTGCLAMYGLGRAGGEAFVHRRFGGDRVDRSLAAIRRHGVLAVLIPSILPPPAPFKIFLVLAGVVGISAGRFASAIAIGRGARYLALSLLAARFGNDAETYLRDHGVEASLTVAAILAAGLALSFAWRKARTPSDR